MTESYEKKLAELEAEVLEEAKDKIETMNAQFKVTITDVCDALQQMANERRNG